MYDLTLPSAASSSSLQPESMAQSHTGNKLSGGVPWFL